MCGLMPKPRNDHCSSCGKPVDRGQCLECTREKKRLYWRRRHPGAPRHRTLREKEVEQECGKRRCTGPCKSWKPLGGFYEGRSWCKDCMRAKARVYAAGIRQKRREGDEHLRRLRTEQKRRARHRA